MKSREHQPLTEPVILFALALLIRLAWIVFNPEIELYSDMRAYIRQSSEPIWVESSYRAPLYPLFLAGLRSLLGDRILGIQVAQSLLGAINCVLVFILARMTFGRRVALGAMGITAVYPNLVVYPRIFMSETLFLTLVLLSAMVLYSIYDRTKGTGNGLGLSLLAGLLAGLATLCRFVFLLSPILYVAIVFRSFDNARRMAIGLALFLVGMSVAIGPWSAKNFVQYDSFVLIAPSGMINLWIGAHHGASGYYDVRGIEEVQARDLLQNDKRAIDAVTQFVRDYPGEFLLLTVKKLSYFWSFYPDGFGIWRNQAKEPLVFPPSFGKWAWAAILNGAFLLIVLGAFAFLFLEDKSPLRAAFPWLLFIVYLWVVPSLATAAQTRFRHPILPFLIILAAAGFRTLSAVLKNRRWNEIGARRLKLFLAAGILFVVNGIWSAYSIFRYWQSV